MEKKTAAKPNGGGKKKLQPAIIPPKKKRLKKNVEREMEKGGDQSASNLSGGLMSFRLAVTKQKKDARKAVVGKRELEQRSLRPKERKFKNQPFLEPGNGKRGGHA